MKYAKKKQEFAKIFDKTRIIEAAVYVNAWLPAETGKSRKINPPCCIDVII